MREGFSPQGYGIAKCLTSDTGPMKPKAVYSLHVLTALREEDRTLCHSGPQGGCTREQSKPQGLWEASFVVPKGEVPPLVPVGEYDRLV